MRRQSEAARGPQRGSPAGVEDDGALDSVQARKSKAVSRCACHRTPKVCANSIVAGRQTLDFGHWTLGLP